MRKANQWRSSYLFVEHGIWQEYRARFTITNGELPSGGRSPIVHRIKGYKALIAGQRQAQLHRTTHTMVETVEFHDARQIGGWDDHSCFTPAIRLEAHLKASRATPKSRVQEKGQLGTLKCTSMMAPRAPKVPVKRSAAASSSKWAYTVSKVL